MVQPSQICTWKLANGTHFLFGPPQPAVLLKCAAQGRNRSLGGFPPTPTLDTNKLPASVAAQSKPAAWPPRRRAMSVDAPPRHCSTRAARRPRTGLVRFRRALGSGCIVQLRLWQRRRRLLGPRRAQLSASGRYHQRPHGTPRQVRPPRRRRHRAGAVTAVACGARSIGRRSIGRRRCEVCFRAGGAAGAARLQAVGGVLRGALLVAVEPPVREPASTGRMLLKTASDGSGYWPSPARRPSGGGGAAGAGTHRKNALENCIKGQFFWPRRVHSVAERSAPPFWWRCCRWCGNLHPQDKVENGARRVRLSAKSRTPPSCRRLCENLRPSNQSGGCARVTCNSPHTAGPWPPCRCCAAGAEMNGNWGEAAPCTERIRAGVSVACCGRCSPEACAPEAADGFRV